VRLLAEAPGEQVIDVLGDVAAPAVADPDERGKLAYLLARSRVRADERAEQFQGTLRLFLAEPPDEQLQPLPRCHASSLTATAVTWRARRRQAGLKACAAVPAGMAQVTVASSSRREVRVPPGFSLCQNSMPPPPFWRTSLAASSILV
jgi:hypothetical protein